MSPEALGVDAGLPPPVDMPLPESLGVFEGVLAEAPLEPASPEALGADAGLPPPVDMPWPESPGAFEGVLAEASLEPASPEALGADAGLPPPVDMPWPESPGVFEGVLAEAPLEPASPEALGADAGDRPRWTCPGREPGRLRGRDSGCACVPRVYARSFPRRGRTFRDAPDRLKFRRRPWASCRSRRSNVQSTFSAGDENVLARAPLQLLAPLEEVPGEAGFP